MSLLLAALLSFQQTDDELRALVERFNSAIEEKSPEGQKLPWQEVRHAGPPILKHLAAVFPGRRVTIRKGCPSMGWEGEREYPMASVMVFGFSEKALPYLIALTRDPDPAKARIAAALLRHFPVKEIVGPLIEFSKSRDLGADREIQWTVNDVLGQATFLQFKSVKDLESWHERSMSRSQADWLREAIDHAEPERVLRNHAVGAMGRLLDAREHLKALLHCFVDLEWREAGFALYGATGHVRDERGKSLWDPAIMAAERAAWGDFRKKREWEQQIEIALHLGTLMSPDEAAGTLLDHADDAFDHLERLAPLHPRCAGAFYYSLPFLATSKSWERVEKFVAGLDLRFKYIGQILEKTRHPSMSDKMLELVLAGAAEGITFRGLTTAFPLRARRDMVPRILEKLPGTGGQTRSTLIRALAMVGDPRGWDVLKEEVFDNPALVSQSIEFLEAFPGDLAVAELRRILRESPLASGAHAARILADRGDHSGIAVLIRALETTAMDDTRVALLCLSQVRGRWPSKGGLPMDPWPGTGAISDFKAWWEKNKTRSRMEWLLESLDEGAESGTPWGAISNPLALLAKEELKDISKDQPEDAYRKAVAKRVRAWVAKTGYAFTKNTVRIPYWPWMEKERR